MPSALVLLLLSAPFAVSQQTEPSAANSSLQQQIDELKAQQHHILNELAELRALIQSGPRRADYPIRPVPATNITLGVMGELFRGDAKAHLAIMEYSDFDCSYCARFATEVYPQLDANYIKPGKVKYFFRDLPAPEHTNSFFKARVARCAGDQGFFWEMHDWLFTQGVKASTDEIKAGASAIGLDMDKFTACVESDRFAANIQRSMAGARRMGLQGTPAFLVGLFNDDGTIVEVTQVLMGGESYEPFRKSLDALLNEGTPQKEENATAKPK